MPGSLDANRYHHLFDGLRRLGYVNGKTIAIDYLSAQGDATKLPALAAECVRLRPNIIVAGTTPSALAAKKATGSIPIVFTSLGDPVGSGLVASLARPGANITGITFQAPSIAAKRIDLLKEVLPKVSRVLVLTYLSDPIARPQVEEMKKAASPGLTLLVRDIRTAADLPAAFEAAAKERMEAVITTAEGIFIENRVQIAILAAKHNLPGVFSSPSFVDAGGLMSYSANFDDLNPRAATYVDKILKGAKPADLPVEQATKFEFVVNLKTAKALGLNIPETILFRADRVIE